MDDEKNPAEHHPSEEELPQPPPYEPDPDLIAYAERGAELDSKVQVREESVPKQ